MMRAMSVFALLLLAACSGSAGPASAGVDGGGGFPQQPLATVQSADAGLALELRSDPQPPVRGQNRFELAILDGAGEPLEGESIEVQPWMPAMGHGSSVTPTVKSVASGRFEIDDVYLAMPGTWELRFTLSGAQSDHATVDVQIP